MFVLSPASGGESAKEKTYAKSWEANKQGDDRIPRLASTCRFQGRIHSAGIPSAHAVPSEKLSDFR
jgi:hypothetical protein